MTQMTDGDAHICKPWAEGGVTEYHCQCGETTRLHILDTGEMFWCKDSEKDAVETVVRVLAQPGVTEISEGSI